VWQAEGTFGVVLLLLVTAINFYLRVSERAFQVIDNLICRPWLQAIDCDHDNIFDYASTDDLQLGYFIMFNPVDADTGIAGDQFLLQESTENSTDALSLLKGRFWKRTRFFSLSVGCESMRTPSHLMDLPLLR
jgi:hypothetical protein